MRAKFFLLQFAFAATVSFAQSNLSVKYFGLTIHPFGDYSASIQPYKLDKNAYFVINFGGFVSYEKFVWYNLLSVKMKQGIFTDCSGGMMGISHLGLQMRLIEKNKHKLSFGIGPTLIYRESWNRFPEYKDSGFWHKYYDKSLGSIQYKMIFYGNEFEYDYRCTDNLDFSADFVPGFPFAFTFAIGVKYWLNKDFKTHVKLVKPSKKKKKEIHVFST